jgi:hypothetical protein
MNKILKFGSVLLALAAILGVGITANAMTEVWSAQVDTFLTLQGGTVGVPQGSLIEIGILNTNEAAMVANQNNPLTLQSYFNAWDTTTVGTGTGVDATFTKTSNKPGTGYFSAQIYLLVFNTPTVTPSSQVGLYTSTATAWKFPASDGAAAGNIDLADIGVMVKIGSYSAGTYNDAPNDILNANAMQLHQVIPEPTTGTLVGLSMAGLLGVMRRRNSKKA